MRFMGRSGFGRNGSKMVRTAFAAARQPTKAGHDAVWRRYLDQKEAEKPQSAESPKDSNEQET